MLLSTFSGPGTYRTNSKCGMKRAWIELNNHNYIYFNK